MTSPSWEASAVQISGLFKQAKRAGIEQQALARCGATTRAVFENPWAARWHPGTALSEFSAAVAAEVGAERFTDLNYEMTRASFGPILRPMVQVALAITGRSPATVFARVPSSLESALRHVTARWEPTSKNSGRLHFDYRAPVAIETEWAWRGALRALSELAGAPLQVDKVNLDLPHGALAFELSWPA